MAPHVEASSLSDITQLASNPPKYPRNPTEPRRASLTLYIARVPGSRDIILTTLKPQLKNVTAADVASSLYYFHLNTEEDARFMEEEPSAEVEEVDSPREKPLPRKPLPETARSSLELNRQMASSAISPGGNLGIPRRKPISSEPHLALSQQQPSQVKLNEARRPLGPRPLLSEPVSQRDPLPGVENCPWISTANLEQGSSASRTSNETSDSTLLQDSAKIHAEVGNDEAFSITVIRRDPSSGAQWNIGNISGHLNDKSRLGRTNPRRKPKKGLFDILIQLSAPGYSPFRVPVPTGNAMNATATAAPSSPDYPSSAQSRSPVAPQWTFDREVTMEGSSFWKRPSVQHRRTLSDLSSKQSTLQGRSSTGSSDFGGADSFLKDGDDGVDPSDSQSKGYTFISPWGGRCKFSTGSSGRILRCKHTLPVPISANNKTDATSPQQGSAPVSELRFNLPSVALFRPSTSDSVNKRSGLDASNPAISKFSNLRKKLSPHKNKPALPPRPHPTSYAAMYPSDDDEEAPPLPPRSYHTTDSSDEEARPPLPARLRPDSYSVDAVHEEQDDDDPHLDLSIGQEKAGGGNRGKRAKLGKLMIHHEGFKMLDLVVAANIGVWWSVWESISL